MIQAYSSQTFRYDHMNEEKNVAVIHSFSLSFLKNVLRSDSHLPQCRK